MFIYYKQLNYLLYNPSKALSNDFNLLLVYISL
nr:MAG TPA: hypothetical protein [Caudoviricetes sp.]